MLPHAAVIVSDAHIGYAPPDTVAAFHRFLRSVPELANHLVINGDLFEFWFEYRSVIPKAAFGTLECLSAVRRAGVKLTLTGGNHDRWGGEFWTRELKARFGPHSLETELVGLTALVAHGDGIGDRQLSARVLQAITRHRVATALFRLVHPDLGHAMVRRLSPYLAGKARNEAARMEAAAHQREHARRVLSTRPDLNLVVLGHTHVSALLEVGPRQWYLNPGAWAEGLCYARVVEDGPVLERFDG
jgi:UDP-2,3-diacylglucosamine hydrolase